MTQILQFKFHKPSTISVTIYNTVTGRTTTATQTIGPGTDIEIAYGHYTLNGDGGDIVDIQLEDGTFLQAVPKLNYQVLGILNG